MAQEEESPTRFSEAEQDELNNDPDADEEDEDLGCSSNIQPPRSVYIFVLLVSKY